MCYQIRLVDFSRCTLIAFIYFPPTNLSITRSDGSYIARISFFFTFMALYIAQICGSWRMLFWSIDVNFFAKDEVFFIHIKNYGVLLDLLDSSNSLIHLCEVANVKDSP